MAEPIFHGRRGKRGGNYAEKRFILPPTLTPLEACKLIAETSYSGSRRPTRDDMITLCRTALRTKTDV